jgi:hypothetical protein
MPSLRGTQAVRGRAGGDGELSRQTAEGMLATSDELTQEVPTRRTATRGT